MNVHLSTIGCRLNEAELSSWRRGLQKTGHRVVNSPDQANVVVLNTCGVTQQAMQSSRKLVRRMHRDNPQAKIVVTGCFSELDPTDVHTLPGVDLVISNATKDNLPDVITSRYGASTKPLTHPFATAKKRRTRAFVKIQDGCSNKCTFCIVTTARGDERSRPIHEVVSEIQSLSESGIQEVVLTGVHIGGYGSDINEKLHVLIQTIIQNTQVPRIRVGSLEPWELTESLVRVMANEPRLCPHLHLPLQSGCNAVLRRMARRYTSQTYARLVQSLRSAVPSIEISTDLMVGFPGESHDDFEQSVRFVEQMGFIHVHTFPFSAREGTAAAQMSNPVSLPERKRRAKIVRDLTVRIRSHKLQQRCGEVRPVLWESPTTGPNPNVRSWSGLTDNYIRVETNLPTDQNIHNQIISTRLTQRTDSNNLTGTLVGS